MTRNPLGWTVTMYTRTGGSIGFWKHKLEDALQEIKEWKKPHAGYVIVRRRYNSRISRYVINKAKNLDDAGMFSKTNRRKSQ